jgi:hypothetical protein
MTCRRICGTGTCKRIPAKDQISCRNGACPGASRCRPRRHIQCKEPAESQLRGHRTFRPSRRSRPARQGWARTAAIAARCSRIGTQTKRPAASPLPELKGLERKVPDPGNKSLFGLRRNKVGGIAQPFRLRCGTFKQCELLRHARRSLRVASLLHVGFQYAGRKIGTEDGKRGIEFRNLPSA